jgi:hypothetical protein
MREVIGLHIDLHTERSRQNVHYRERALLRLGFGKEAGFQWLADFERMKAGKPHAWRKTILAELGRIEDEDDFRAIALRICELKPKTHDAVAMIRDARFGRHRVGRPDDLANELVSCINDYMTRKRATEWLGVIEALEIALLRVRETVESLEDDTDNID